MTEENVAAALTGDAIPMVGREVYYAASEMQLLEDSISKFKAKLHALIGVGSSSSTRRKKVRAVWEDTKEAAKKMVDTALLKEMELVDWTVELRHLIRRLAKHRALPEKESVEYLEDEPPPRTRPGTTVEGRINHPEQTLAVEELTTGVKVQGLSEVIAAGLRKTTVTATVVMEEPKCAPSEEEEELSDPVSGSGNRGSTYIRAFDLDSSHSDAAMREAGDDWSQMDKEKQKSLNKQEFVEKKARQYVKMKKSLYMRTRIYL
jgi:hypothetical protein